MHQSLLARHAALPAIVALIVAMAASANGALIGQGSAGALYGNGSDNVTINWARYSVNIPGITGLEEIVFKIGTITAPSKQIITVTGAIGQPNVASNWVASTGGQIALSSDNKSWLDNTYKSDILFSNSHLGPPQSYVNMDFNLLVAYGRTPAPSQTTFGAVDFGDDGYFTFKGYSEFHGNWGSFASDLTDGSILADLFVSTGTNVTYIGELGLRGGAGEVLKGSFASQSTPEPSTLALLAAAAISLLCYGWRRRA
jgi:hypothetical protein